MASQGKYNSKCQMNSIILELEEMTLESLGVLLGDSYKLQLFSKERE
jgi:hypothetical protein